ncbi:MAG: T9SS type A sorting domain-containing protein [Chitinophagaceae bacterium]
MGVVKLKLLVCVLIYSNSIYAQKIWDGEAGDSLWHNPRNWFPDGIPLASDNVIIDNSLMSGSYKILITGIDSIVINSLNIKPKDNNQIIVEITPSSTLPIAMYILSSDRSVELSKNGILINQTGASSGNVFSLNGKIYIHNDGKYIHKTIRGNSYIISKLEIDSNNSKGIVEFDVPGTSGYTLSLSGRKFGSLILNATGGRKSYTGNGINPLNIEGDLMIEKNATLSSSLTNTISVKGNLIVDGSCVFNPSSSDSSGRTFKFSGDSSMLKIHGKLSTGIHFNHFIFGSKHNWVQSNLHIEYGDFIFGERAFIHLDTFYLKSINGIQVNHAAVVETANPEGISTDSTIGTLRTAHISWYDSIHLLYTAKGSQNAGTGIPKKLSSLSINKSGVLYLNQPLEITDSLKMYRGIVYTDTIRNLLFSGKYLISNDSAFVHGPLQILARDSGRIKFPIGKNNHAAPIFIDMNKDESITTEYFDTSYSTQENQMEFPVKYVNKEEYWKITCKGTDSTNLNRSIVFSLNKSFSTSNTYIVRLSTSEKWELLPLISNNPLPNSIETKTTLKSSVYTTGLIQQVALARQRFQLVHLHLNKKNMLSWNYDSNDHTIQYFIESSEDAISFKSIDSIKAIKGQIDKSYQYVIKDRFNSKNYYRIRAQHHNEINHYSNIVMFQQETTSGFPYPNPCSNMLFLRMGKDVQPMVWAIDQQGRKVKINQKQHENHLEIDVSKLNNGLYHLITITNGYQQSFRFIKL